MPAIDTVTGGGRQPRKKRVRVRKPKQAYKVTVPDAGDSSRTTRATSRPRYKVTVPDQKDATRSRRVSKPLAGDAPQTRKVDTQKAENYVRKQYEKSRPATNRLYVKGTTVPPDVRKRANNLSALRNPKSGALTASIQGPVKAPILKVLDQTTRPLHAIAAAADVAVNQPNLPGSRKSVGKAMLRGLENKDKTTFSDVLKHAGVKNKTIRAVAGTGLDIGLDPTTYVSGGTASIARKEAEKAAKSATKKAAKAGLSEEQAAKFGDRAYNQALKRGDQTKGVTVKVAGKEIPGVRKATAKASKPVRVVARKVTPGKVREHARAVAADLNPDVAPVGVSKETSRTAVQATRTARARAQRGAHEAQQHAVGIREMVGEANYSRIIDAIENGTIGKLPPELRDVAVRVRSQFRHANRVRKQAGIRGGEIKHRRRVDVPEVTADVDASAKAVGKARRAEQAAQRAVETARQYADVHQGRAEVLSRNVSGARAEKAAERGRRKRKVRIPAQYAGGGHGVQQTATVLHAAEQQLKHATAAREASEAAHEATKGQAAAQRTAQQHALETNAKRAAAPREYIPHQLTDETLAAEGKATTGGVGRKVIRPSSSRSRSDNRPLSVLRGEKPGQYSEDLPALYHSHQMEGATAAARAELNRRIADLGHAVKKGRDILLGEGESVYHIVGSDLKKVTDKKELARLADTGSHSGPMKGRYVVLNDDTVKRAIEGSQATMQGPGIIRGYDALQGGFKRTALATPGFHVRNAVGDTQNAYLGQAGYKIPRNMTQAARVLKAEGRRDRALKGLKRPDPKASSRISSSRVAVAGRRVNRVVTRRHLDEHGSDAVLERFALGRAGISREKDPLIGGRVYVARNLAGEPVGRLSFGMKDGRVDGISVYVRKDSRRQGIGTKLYDAARRDGYDIDSPVSRVRTDAGDAFTASRRSAAKGIRTPRYGRVTYEQVAEQLAKHGAMRSGYTARELPELSKGRLTARMPDGMKRAFLNREDLPRVTTALEALKRGATWEEAAQRVADFHFDYGHLTNFERQIARRFFPFYTFTARNVVRQGKSLVTNPGKYANYEKIREEAAKATGMDEDARKTKQLTLMLKQAGVKLPSRWEAMLSEYEQRNAGIPISYKGHKLTVSAGLPLGDLNEFPGAALSSQLSEWYQKGMSLTGPIPKDIIEWMENHSFYFRDQVEKDNAPLVAAPAWVKFLPGNLKKLMGVTPNYIDKKTGKKTWGYRAKADYVVKAIPGTPQYVQKFATPGNDRLGKGPVGKALSFAGIKATPFDPVKAAVDMAYQRQADIEKRLTILRAQGIGKDNPTQEWRRLSDQLKIVNQITYQGKAAQGYKVLPRQGGPPKPRGGSSPRVKFGDGSTSRVHFGVSSGSRVRFGG